MATTVIFRGLNFQRLGSVCRPATVHYTKGQTLILQSLQTRTLSSDFRGRHMLVFVVVICFS